MATLSFTTLDVPASRLGSPNPLADLSRPHRAKAEAHFDPANATPEVRYSLASHVFGCLPYHVLDGFDRSTDARPLQVAVLENDRFRATFLLELGGRLWSLVHKPTGRELLYQPRVLHFVNIGICHAWFCGGVEWNVAVRGHAAYTCSPVFAAAVEHPRFGPGLRIWEWDRFRGLIWQVDFLLPDDSPALLARPRVVNTRNEGVPMYWWSNIAVHEAPGHRVLVPAEHAFQHDYDRNILRRPVPFQDDRDVSYPTNSPAAHDFFYDIPPDRRPWIACLDGEGAGLVHASTRRLLGRKLFVWGMGPGGRHWQRQLGGGPGKGYVELQGGLARTQAEYVPMPARARWAWMEAYSLMEADAAIAHGPDWPGAWGHVQRRLDEILPQAALDRLLEETADLADAPAGEIRSHGSGWGALERERRARDGEDDPVPPGLAFPEADDGPERPWHALLREGLLPCAPPGRAPKFWVTSPPWRKRLAEAVAAGRGDHWLAWLHLGVMAWREGDPAAAEDAWRTSLAREPSAWACRNLAVLAAHAGRTDEAAELGLRAAGLQPDCLPLQVECGQTLLEARRIDELTAWLAELPPAIADDPRIRLQAAWAAYHRDELDAAEAMLEHIRLATVREGRSPLTDLWFAIQAKRLAVAEGVPLDDALDQRVRETLTPPAYLDYRMG